MKRFVCWLAAGLCGATLAAGAEHAKAAEDAPALSPFSLGVFMAYWHVGDLDEFDLDGALGGGIEGQIRLHRLLAIDLRLSGFGAAKSEAVYDSCDCWTDREIALYAMPLEAGLLVTLPLGDQFDLYGGPGLGYYFFDAEYRLDYGYREILYDLDLDDEGGFYALFGFRARLAPNAAVFCEGKYTWVETSFESRDEYRDRLGLADLQSKIDFSGLAFTAGLLFTF